MNIVCIKTIGEEYNGYTVWHAQFLKQCIELGHCCYFVNLGFLIAQHDYNWGLKYEYPNSELFNAYIESLNPDVIIVLEEINKLPPSFFEKFKGKIIVYTHDVCLVCPSFGYNKIEDRLCEKNVVNEKCYNCVEYDSTSFSQKPFFLSKEEWWKLIRDRFSKVHLVAPSNFIIDFFDCHNLCLSTTVVPNGIDIQPGSYLRHKGNKKVLLVSGWSDKYDSIGDITSKLKLSISNGFEFYSTGYSDNYIKYIAPIIDRKEIKSLYSGFDIYLSLYQMKESYSLALAEANNFGLATVVLANTGATLDRDPTVIIKSLPTDEHFELELYKALDLASKLDTIPLYEGSMAENLTKFILNLEKQFGGM